MLAGFINSQSKNESHLLEFVNGYMLIKLYPIHLPIYAYQNI